MLFPAYLTVLFLLLPLAPSFKPLYNPSFITNRPPTHLYTSNDIPPAIPPTEPSTEPPTEPPTEPTATEEYIPVPITKLTKPEEYTSFLASNPDSLVVMKFFAPWCRACKGLSPKFTKISIDPSNAGVIFAQFDVQHNKDFVKSLGILALPNIHFYAGEEGMTENFPCGPTKVPILRTKLDQYVNGRLDPVTGKCCSVSAEGNGVSVTKESVPCKERVGEGAEMTPSLLKTTRNITYFRDMPSVDFDAMCAKFVLSSYDPGSVIMLQGNPNGKTFYVVASGEVEVVARTGYEDPLTTPASYLGAVVNRLPTGNFFGERSLITGEPRAASILAVKGVETTRCFVIKQSDIPASCPLSASSRLPATAEVYSDLDLKYGTLSYIDEVATGQSKFAARASQVRGSVHYTIPKEATQTTSKYLETLSTPDRNEPAYYLDAIGEETEPAPEPVVFDTVESAVEAIPLLIKFKLVRQTARCFEHIMKSNPKWGNPNEIYRRSLFVGQLSDEQKREIKEVFGLIDDNHEGTVSVLELKRFMESIMEVKSDEELTIMINKANPMIDGNTELFYDEFLGIMAESEFYYLFLDTFQALDKYNSGFIRAGDLKQILNNLGGVNFGSDERTSVVKADDDLLINYESFSRMLVGV